MIEDLTTAAYWIGLGVLVLILTCLGLGIVMSILKTIDYISKGVPSAQNTGKTNFEMQLEIEAAQRDDTYVHPADDANLSETMGCKTGAIEKPNRFETIDLQEELGYNRIP